MQLECLVCLVTIGGAASASWLPTARPSNNDAAGVAVWRPRPLTMAVHMQNGKLVTIPRSQPPGFDHINLREVARASTTEVKEEKEEEPAPAHAQRYAVVVGAVAGPVLLAGGALFMYGAKNRRGSAADEEDDLDSYISDLDGRHAFHVINNDDDPTWQEEASYIHSSGI